MTLNATDQVVELWDAIQILSRGDWRSFATTEERVFIEILMEDLED